MRMCQPRSCAEHERRGRDRRSCTARSPRGSCVRYNPRQNACKPSGSQPVGVVRLTGDPPLLGESSPPLVPGPSSCARPCRARSERAAARRRSRTASLAAATCWSCASRPASRFSKGARESAGAESSAPGPVLLTGTPAGASSMWARRTRSSTTSEHTASSAPERAGAAPAAKRIRTLAPVSMSSLLSDGISSDALSASVPKTRWRRIVAAAGAASGGLSPSESEPSRAAVRAVHPARAAGSTGGGIGSRGLGAPAAAPVSLAPVPAADTESAPSWACTSRRRARCAPSGVPAVRSTARTSGPSSSK
mmetsp:Transcript_3673/g.12234  ORF Transcript_3673/g.12234 Transcript_3673/m.12234 type:complete len:307 (-) Transcript_3673:947-1867(-)